MKTEQEEIRRKPPHPGEQLREEFFQALNMTVTQLAEHLGVSRVALSELLNERRSISMEMAQRLGKAFGNGTRFWLSLQMQRDAWDADHNIRVAVKPLKQRSGVTAA